MASGKEKKRFISYKVDSYLRDKFLARPKRRELFSESFVRVLNHIRFTTVCCLSLSQALAPWVLCAMEVVLVLVLYLVGTSNSILLHPVAPYKYHFSYKRSLEDIAILSCTRAAILSIAYGLGTRAGHRPYLYVAYLLAAACFPYIVVKTILFRYGHDGVVAAAIFGLTGAFSWIHVFAARRTVDWSRRRYQMGLPGFGMPWEESEEPWLLRRPGPPDLEDLTKTSDGGLPENGEDLPAEMLADEDSKFVQLDGIKVHYKEVHPPVGMVHADGSSGDGIAVVLVHGFGGGVFAWRHVMEPLAMQCQCRVVAFDRPAFGLTSRPRATAEVNYYTVPSQATLLLRMCSALGIRRALLVAHADGCLVTLQAAITALQQHGVGSTHAFSGQCGTSAAAGAEAPGSTVGSVPAGAGSAGPSCMQSCSCEASFVTLTVADLASQQHPQLDHGELCSQLGGSGSPLGSSGGGSMSIASEGSGSLGGEATCNVLVLGSSSSVHGSFQGTADALAAHPVAASQQWQSSEDAQPSSGHPHLPKLVTASSAFVPGSLQELEAPSTLRAEAGLDQDGTGSSPASSINISTGLSNVSAAPGAGQGTRSWVFSHPPLLPAHAHGGLQLGAAGGSGTPAHRSHSLPASSSQVPSGSKGSGSWEQHYGEPCSSCNCLFGVFSATACGLGLGGPGCSNQLGANQALQVLGIVLLHPNLSGTMGPTLSRLLARSKLGRSILRPLLRTEIGEVSNRHAWHNMDKLTPEVLEMYKNPLRVEGWDEALMEVTRNRREDSTRDLPAAWSALRATRTRMLIMTGEHDRIVPPSKADALLNDMPEAHVAVLPGCGHLSLEEAPGALLEQLVPFCGEVLVATGKGAQGCCGGKMVDPAAANSGAPVTMDATEVTAAPAGGSAADAGRQGASNGSMIASRHTRSGSGMGSNMGLAGSHPSWAAAI